MIEFRWDNKKADNNLKKHGVSFEEAKSVFYDERSLLIHDPVHYVNEDRFIILGISIKVRVLVVCHCYRENDTIIRIISARKANRHEQQNYREVER